MKTQRRSQKKKSIRLQKLVNESLKQLKLQVNGKENRKAKFQKLLAIR